MCPGAEGDSQSVATRVVISAQRARVVQALIEEVCSLEKRVAEAEQLGNQKCFTGMLWM